ncbi:hypothetical protein [Citrobacter rodentium]|uniref:Membrane protein n=2 Tax=Citrobacter rodentium TaxID=67825 RepID=D2TID1_CITRI|nr:hypothetical protein [Citrobacter rodentium]KIQ48702.1 hypothetical protein TA05_25415 [Citrobacter rodentium]QBY28088.1 hypothetical protein E2R62_04000 [Citrobacter rodentium]UHO30035.1 hypothetical protein K7R23_18835 [Citrobacter rodentium NBRC 105723 = DSM 16636]CBG88258.1 putative membrane protein [Citrobacter rodentium ICC168]HAT8011465.1 hypothetical protein [Citrobacter rodentium NBRC 105723 = DSM 16636]
MPGSDEAKHAIPFIEESRRALNFEDKFRRIGFTFLLLIIIAASVGLFSNGYFSASQATNDSQRFHVEYEKYGRLLKDDTLKISVRNAASDLTLRLGKDFTTAFQTEMVTPQPDKMYSHNDQLILYYAPSSDNDNVTVRITAKPQKPGYFHTAISANDEPALVISQWIYP